MSTRAEIDAGVLDRVAAADHVWFLTDRELRLVLSGLKRLRHQIKSDIAQQKRDGWKPAPGKHDNNMLRLAGVDRLLKRYDKGE